MTVFEISHSKLLLFEKWNAFLEEKAFQIEKKRGKGMPIEYNGQILRSKNELIGCKGLEIDGENGHRGFGRGQGFCRGANRQAEMDRCEADRVDDQRCDRSFDQRHHYLRKFI